MTRPTLPGSTALGPLRDRWNALGAREQMLVSVALGLVGLALLWWVALAPALRTLNTADAQQAALDAQLQVMQGLQIEARALQSQPGLSRDDAVRALEASVKQRLGPAAQFSMVGDRATITLKGAPADGVAQWLTQARVNARALPSEARLVRTAGGAGAAGNAAAPAWDGTLVLSLPPQ